MRRPFRDAANVLFDLGEHLREARRTLDLTQQDVADATGLWTSQVSYLERQPDYGLGRGATIALLLWLDEVTARRDAESAAEEELAAEVWRTTPT